MEFCHNRRNKLFTNGSLLCLYSKEKVLRVPVLFTSCHWFDTISVIDRLWQKKKECHCRNPPTKEVKKKTAS